ncbi:hypothetical protein MKY59_21105 [Paenibacillus sp. FSL W8-0426]|uniref:hypothetical protein n=1 Tax=Paenibacillus sp. FSL W8-0426 TaxID=2921714 RepID=UPI0030D70F22
MPTFDLGGFFGGIIGTVGAFLVAKYTLVAQEKKETPKLKSAQYLLYKQFKGIINAVNWELIMGDESVREIKMKLLICVNRLQDLVPNTFEHGEIITRELLQLIEDITDLGTKGTRPEDKEILISDITELVSRYSAHFDEQMMKILPKPNSQ